MEQCISNVCIALNQWSRLIYEMSKILHFTWSEQPGIKQFHCIVLEFGKSLLFITWNKQTEKWQWNSHFANCAFHELHKHGAFNLWVKGGLNRAKFLPAHIVCGGCWSLKRIGKLVCSEQSEFCIRKPSSYNSLGDSKPVFVVQKASLDMFCEPSWRSAITTFDSSRGISNVVQCHKCGSCTVTTMCRCWLEKPL